MKARICLFVVVLFVFLSFFKVHHRAQEEQKWLVPRLSINVSAVINIGWDLSSLRLVLFSSAHHKSLSDKWLMRTMDDVDKYKEFICPKRKALEDAVDSAFFQS